MVIVAISGKRRSGKSFLGAQLAREYGFRQVSLAAPLKAMVREHFGLTTAQTDGDLKEVYDERLGMTPRELMIKFGGFYRSVDQNYWVKKLFDQIKLRPQAQLGRYVITDLRFKNELDWMKRHNALLVRLERDTEFTGEPIDDPSEKELDDFTGWDIHVPKEQNVNELDMAKTAGMVEAYATRRAA